MKMIPAKLDRFRRELGLVSVVEIKRTKNIAVIALRKMPIPKMMKPR